MTIQLHAKLFTTILKHHHFTPHNLWTIQNVNIAEDLRLVVLMSDIYDVFSLYFCHGFHVVRRSFTTLHAIFVFRH